MPAALPVQDKVSLKTTSTVSFKVLQNQYGNGYSQRAADGINNNQSSVAIAWENIGLTDFNTICTALDTAYGVDYFTWQQPGDSTTKKWVVPTYQRSFVSGNVYSVSATLNQVFDL